MELMVMVLILAALALIGPLVGTDSRDGMDWRGYDSARRVRSNGSLR